MSKRKVQGQRGAATLVVVMVLFFVMAMMAAFANRNLMFEQRISSNYYRAGVAFDAADAGTEWALAMLNGGNVNAQCTTSGSPTVSFRDRYLNFNTSTRQITPKFVANPLVADCVHKAGGAWQCNCRIAAWAPQQTGEVAAMQPTFVVAMTAAPELGAVTINTASCTTNFATCEDAGKALDVSPGNSQVSIEAALVSALKMPPASPLTIAGAVTMDATGLGLHNSAPRSSGLLMLTGGSMPTGWVDSRLNSLPGTPWQQAMISGDNALSTLPADRIFAMFFGMAPARYRDQPAARVITCSSDCMTDLATAYGQGVRIAWINGAAALSSNVTLGSTADPMLIVVNGTLNVTGPMQINGLLYSRGNISWTNTSAQLSLLTGGLIGEGTLDSFGLVDLAYDAGVMDVLSNKTGSFVRVPGSWRDGTP
jgi:Tfp pilus assembly protein PilX